MIEKHTSYHSGRLLPLQATKALVIFATLSSLSAGAAQAQVCGGARLLRLRAADRPLDYLERHDSLLR